MQLQNAVLLALSVEVNACAALRMPAEDGGELRCEFTESCWAKRDSVGLPWKQMS